MNANQTILYHSETGELVKVGDKCLTFRGELATVCDWTAPRHAGSTGRVLLQIKGVVMEFFPTVIGCEIR